MRKRRWEIWYWVSDHLVPFWIWQYLPDEWK